MHGILADYSRSYLRMFDFYVFHFNVYNQVKFFYDIKKLRGRNTL